MRPVRQRYTAVYATLLVLLLGLFLVGRSTTWQSDAALHTIWEVVATVLALVIGAPVARALLQSEGESVSLYWSGFPRDRMPRRIPRARHV